MAPGRRDCRLGLAVILYLAVLTSAAPAPAQQESAQRLAVSIGRPQIIPMADVSAVMAINENIALATPCEGGFTVLGKSTGDTIVQVFTASSLHVYVVVVQPPPPGPPPPPPPPNLGERGPVKSFWADNRYQLRYVSSSFSGQYFDHVLDFHGRVGQGEYRAMGDFTHGDIGNRFQHGNVSWTSDQGDLSFTVGDTSGRLYGSSLAGGVGLRGGRVTRTYKLADKTGTWGYELFTGELISMADPRGTQLTQPVVGGNVEASFSPRMAPDLSVTLASSSLLYSTARTSEEAPGQTGIILGAVARAAHGNGFGFELRSGLSSTTPHQVEARPETAATLGLQAFYKTDLGSQRVEYELIGAGFASPQVASRIPGAQRFSASFSRTIRGVTGTGGAGYALMHDNFGNSLDALSYRFGVVLPVHRQTTFTLAAGEATTPMVVSSADGKRGLAAWSQAMIGGRLDHTTRDGRFGIQSEINYLKTQSSQGDAIGTTALLNVQRRRLDDSKWDGALNVNVTASQAQPKPASDSSTLAVDQPPLNLGVSTGVQGRFMQGPFQSFGGLGLQTMALPTFQANPTVNLGIQFTPTSAHQLVANFSMTRWSQRERNTYNSTVNYTYRFGDAVRAVPLFEFMSYGMVEGRVCFDENSDGLCASDEPPLPNIPLRLSNGQAAVSDARGNYRFERVKPGFYHIEVDEERMRDRGRPTTMLAASFQMPVRGEEHHHFAVARACRIQGHLIHDLDLDGQGADGEPLFPGPLVIATGAEGKVQMRVNNIGTFAATVPCGEYDLELDPASLPALHSPGSEQAVHVVTSITNIAAPRLLVTAIRTVGGEVFLDRNRNGKKDAGEPAVADIKVRFGKSIGVSDETGAFLLRQLPAGQGSLAVDAATLPPSLQPGAPIPLDLKADATVIEDLQVPVLPAP